MSEALRRWCTGGRAGGGGQDAPVVRCVPALTPEEAVRIIVERHLVAVAAVLSFVDEGGVAVAVELLLIVQPLEVEGVPKDEQPGRRLEPVVARERARERKALNNIELQALVSRGRVVGSTKDVRRGVPW